MTFIIHQTQTSPYAAFKNGYLIISGKSLPLHHPNIYNAIEDKLMLYAQKPDKTIKIDIKLSIANALTKRSIINTLKLLENLNKNRNRVIINWFYHDDDVDMKEFGEFCKSCFKINIELHAISD